MRKVAILQFPGTNCDLDTKYAFEKMGLRTSIIWHKETTIEDDVDLVVVAGGFFLWRLSSFWCDCKIFTDYGSGQNLCVKWW